MKIFLLLFMTITLSRCQQSQSKSTADKNDSLDGMSAEDWQKHYVDSMSFDITNRAFYDTVGVSEAPVKVIRARMIERDYSNYKDIQITYKNITTKRIVGIKFSWHGENVFSDPADMGGLQEGFGGGFDDEGLKVGQTVTHNWNIMSRDGKKVSAWPREVVFEDGSKWESKSL